MRWFIPSSLPQMLSTFIWQIKSECTWILDPTLWFYYLAAWYATNDNSSISVANSLLGSDYPVSHLQRAWNSVKRDLEDGIPPQWMKKQHRGWFPVRAPFEVRDLKQLNLVLVLNNRPISIYVSRVVALKQFFKIIRNCVSLLSTCWLPLVLLNTCKRLQRHHQRVSRSASTRLKLSACSTQLQHLIFDLWS